MTKKELRELDAWIAFHVTKCTPELVKIKLIDGDIDFHFAVPHYTTDAAAALEVLKACCMKTYQFGRDHFQASLLIQEHRGHWEILLRVPGSDAHLHTTAGPTLETCICLFAKALFSTTLAPNQ